MTDLNKILEAIKAANSPLEVRTIVVDKKDVFDKKEKALLDSTRIKDVTEARKAAELLARIKVAIEKKQKDDDLLDKLEKERDENSFVGSNVFRVLNVNNSVRNAIDYLTFLSTGIPENKEERKKKSERLQKEIGEKRGELALNNSALTPLEAQHKAALEDEEDAKRLLDRREALLSVVSGDSATDFTIAYKGDPAKAISTINTALQTADGFLTAITNINSGKNSGYGFVYDKARVSYFNGRDYHSKSSLMRNIENIGYTFLATLRKIGVGKLKDLITASGATGTQKDRLNKIAERMVECIHSYEEYTGEKGYSSKPIDRKNISYFIAQPGTDPKIKQELLTANKFPSDWNFKQVVQEENLENSRCGLRYALTMREVLNSLGFSKQVSDFDDYLLEIADRAEKKNYSTDRHLLLSGDSVKNALLQYKLKGSQGQIEKIAKGEIWGEDYTKSRAEVMRELIESARSNVTVNKGRAEAIARQIGQINEKNALITFEINRKKRELQDLKDVGDFEEAPLADKKKIFEDLYNKKTSQDNK
ncbi:8309_t:CDS:2 [Funneliformis geosporum]|nr:8309_t:CDS:2 [Funneliformis geosporum]